MGDPAGSWEPGGGFVWSFAKTMGFSMFCAWDIAQTMVFFSSLVLLLGLRQNHGFSRFCAWGCAKTSVFSMFLDIKTRKGAFKDPPPPTPKKKKKKKALGLGSHISSLGPLVPAGFELGLRCSSSSPLDRSWPLGGALASMSSQQTPSPPAVRVFAFTLGFRV